MLVRVNLCKSCAATLKAVKDEKGEDAMAMAVAPTLQNCFTCREQLPKPWVFTTRLKFDLPR
jgi:hypothetical protein